MDLTQFQGIENPLDLLSKVVPDNPSFYRSLIESEQLLKERGSKQIMEIQRKWREYEVNPFKFLTNELGIRTDRWHGDRPPIDWTGNYWPLWSKQRAILRALQRHKKVAVKSGHGVGKTYIAAASIFWLLYVKRALGVTTAPGFRQVKRLLWGEIHNMFNNALRPLGGELNQTSLELGPKWYCEGFSTKDPENMFQGFHEETVFVVIDEAGAVNPHVFEVMDTVLTSENSYVLLIGNPVDGNHPFADFFKSDSGFFPIQMSVLESPNIVHQHNIYPKLTAVEWVDRMRDKWSDKSSWWRSRVEGDFPEISGDYLISYSSILAAMERDKTRKTKEDKVASIGVDVARYGDDCTSIGVMFSSGKFRIVEYLPYSSVLDTAEAVCRVYSRYEKRALVAGGPCINVDDIGVGGGVTDILEDKKLPVNPITVSESPSDFYDDSGDMDLDLFYNLRSQLWWKVKTDFFDNGKIDLEDDDELMEEIRNIGYSMDRVIKVESKRDIKKRLKRSPDKADCLMLTLASTEVPANDNLIRWL